MVKILNYTEQPGVYDYRSKRPTPDHTAKYIKYLKMKRGNKNWGQRLLALDPPTDPVFTTRPTMISWAVSGNHFGSVQTPDTKNNEESRLLTI